MKIRDFLHMKNGLLALCCVLIVAVCAGLAVWFSAGRRYAEVIGSSPGGMLSPDSSAAAGESGEEERHDILEKQGVSVTVQSDLPEGLDPVRFIKQAYELKYLLAAPSFSSAGDLPVSQAVQYAFCYLYANGGCLVDVKPAAMTYRQAAEQEIRDQISALFGSCPFDVKKSDLYVPGKQCFEMWQPNYSRDVYAAASFQAAEDGAYTIAVTYFEDAEKTKAAGEATVTVRRAGDGGFYLASMA